MSALKELREKVAAGTLMIPTTHTRDYPSTWTTEMGQMSNDAYHGSLDAAKALHEAVLGPDWAINITLGAAFWDVDLTHFPYRDEDRRQEWDVTVGPEDDPARAWLLAILDALIAKEASDG